MNWYEELFVKKDVRLPENHIVRKDHRNLWMTMESQNKTIFMYFGSAQNKEHSGWDQDKFPPCNVNFWLKTYISDDGVSHLNYVYHDGDDLFLSHNDNGLPNRIQFWSDDGVDNIVVKWINERRIGPDDITMKVESGLVTSCIMAFTSHHNDDYATFCHANLESDYYSPFETEFCYDDLTRMKLASILSVHNNEPAIGEFCNG